MTKPQDLTALTQELRHGSGELNNSMSFRNRVADTIEKLVKERDAKLLVPGVMRCAKCNFQLIRTNLNVLSGTATAGNSDTEPCPNGCGPLWPITWEQYAKQAMDSAEQMFEEARAEKARADALQATVTAQASEIDRLNAKDVMLKKWGDKAELLQRLYNAGIEQEREIVELKNRLEAMDPAVISCYAIPVNEWRYADEIVIQRTRQIDGPPLWAVRLKGDCLNKQGEWEGEPQPSSRDDDFLARCRFDTANAAIAAATVARDAERNIAPPASTFDSGTRHPLDAA